MNEKMNGGISTMRGMFCRLPCQKGGITANPLRHKALAAASFLSTHDKMTAVSRFSMVYSGFLSSFPWSMLAAPPKRFSEGANLWREYGCFALTDV